VDTRADPDAVEWIKRLLPLPGIEPRLVDRHYTDLANSARTGNVKAAISEAFVTTEVNILGLSDVSGTICVSIIRV
jgi:hypothetical protein